MLKDGLGYLVVLMKIKIDMVFYLDLFKSFLFYDVLC